MFVETGCSVKHKKSSGCPSTRNKVVELARQSFVNSPTESPWCTFCELQVPHRTVWRFVEKTFAFEAVPARIYTATEQVTTGMLVSLGRNILPMRCLHDN